MLQENGRTLGLDFWKSLLNLQLTHPTFYIWHLVVKLQTTEYQQNCVYSIIFIWFINNKNTAGFDWPSQGVWIGMALSRSPSLLEAGCHSCFVRLCPDWKLLGLEKLPVEDVAMNLEMGTNSCWKWIKMSRITNLGGFWDWFYMLLPLFTNYCLILQMKIISSQLGSK